eukprot:403363551
MSARKVIVIYHEKIENRKQFKKILNKLEHTYNVVVIETNSNDSNLKKCLSQQSDHETSKNCPLIIEFKEDQSISKTQIVSEDNKVSVIVKDHQVVYPLDLDSIFFSLLEKRGEIIGHQDTQNRKTIDDIQMVHFTHNLVNPSSDYIQDESQEKLETIILEESQIILDKVYGNTFSKPQVVYSQKQVPIQALQKFQQVSSAQSFFALKSEALIEFIAQNSLHHQIPSYNLKKKDSQKYLNIQIFNSLNIGQSIRFVKEKGQGENFAVAHSDVGDLTIASLNSENLNQNAEEDKLTNQIRFVIKQSLQKALDIESLQDLIDQAKRKKIQIIDKTHHQTSQSKKVNDLQLFVSNQVLFDRMQDTKDLIAIIEILKLNELEKNKLIYQGKSVFELVSQIYNKIVAQFENDKSQQLFSNRQSDHNLKPLDEETKNIIGILYYTKEINSPYFFSLSFSIGVYLPLLSPLVFPPVLTFIAFLKHWKVSQSGINQASIKKKYM